MTADMSERTSRRAQTPQTYHLISIGAAGPPQGIGHWDVIGIPLRRGTSPGLGSYHVVMSYTGGPQSLGGESGSRFKHSRRQ